MDIDIQYGQASQRLRVDEGRFIGNVSPKNTPADTDSVARSLSNPVGFADLNSFLEGRKRILVVVNDHTRATPSLTVLKVLNLKDKEVVTIIATGTHRSPNARELPVILGNVSPPYGGMVAVHDSRSESSLRSLGETSRGTKLFMNSHLFDADGIVAVGSVEPHYFAGFTGGRKFFLPALAGFRSVEMNHALALDPRVRVLALDGNPVHEDFMDALRIFNRQQDIFSIQLVLNARQQISYTNSGNVVDSFTDAVKHAKEVYTSKLKNKSDIVIAVTKPPLDLDLYQSHKAIENVKLALKDDGVLILVSKCLDGIGNREFYDLLAGGNEAIDKARESGSFGSHKAVKFHELLERAHVFAVTGLPPKVLRTIGVESFADVQNALDKATSITSKDSHVLVVDDAGVVVPVPEER